VRVGIVCPYSFDLPGGVQAHIRDLAEALIGLGHQVSVLAPAEDEEALPPYVVAAGRSMALRYNGSVARVAIGPMSLARVRRWLREGHFDVLHVHEPTAPSLSFLACLAARGPIVATFHTATTRSRALAAAHAALQPVLEKIGGRIAVSPLARRVQVEHLAGNAVEIPNGVAVERFAVAVPLPGWPPPGGAVGFLGRFDEPRKGFAVLRAAWPTVIAERPEARLLVAGPGDSAEALGELPADVRDTITMLGLVSDQDKARMLHSIDVYVAPNLGGESFGIILTEAMAAGVAVVASELDAFRRVLDDGRAGLMVPIGDPAALAAAITVLLADPDRRAALQARAWAAVQAYDWSTVARRVVEVYEMTVAATPVSVTGDDTSHDERLAERLRSG
jgi:phosphatidylinositol alpha-mannosyltransferase